MPEDKETPATTDTRASVAAEADEHDSENTASTEATPNPSVTESESTSKAVPAPNPSATEPEDVSVPPTTSSASGPASANDQDRNEEIAKENTDQTPTEKSTANVATSADEQPPETTTTSLPANEPSSTAADQPSATPTTVAPQDAGPEAAPGRSASGSPAEVASPGTSAPEPLPEKTEAPKVDYASFTKEELAEAIEAQLQNDDVAQADAEARRMRSHADQLLDTEREVALQKYLADGGEADGFEFRPDVTHERFLTAYRQIQTKKKSRAADQRKQRQGNLEAKQHVLDSLRELVDSEETQVSMNRLRELQTEWRATGPVPPQHNRSLWANYHALLDRFYDKRGIYFELKELDRKKNLEAKQALSERAQALVDEPDLRKAVSELDELHEEYKHIGPVPKEEQEPLWQRFKAASDHIHDRRRESVEKFKEELEANLGKKRQLIEEVTLLGNFTSDSIKEWNQKTKEVQDVKKRWEAVGSMPRKQAKRVNKEFWSHFKQFFARKGEFFKQLDAERATNLEKKEALVAQAESLRDSDDWKTTGQELKRLQQEWKEIGPVPGKVRESVYRRFKAACDHFFSRRRGDSQETEAEYAKNLQEKEAICKQIEQLATTEGATQEQLLGLTDTYASIGFVPRGDVQRIQKRFDKAVKKVVQKLEVSDTQKQKISAEVELSSLKASPGADRKIDQKENQLRRKISQMEDDIALWTNNISFFAASKGADKLKADFEQRIAQAQEEVEQLKAQLGALQNIR